MTHFNELSWHDAEILGITIPRSNPGHQDTLELSIKWPDGKKSFLIFYDCYQLNLALNLGVIAPETIRDAVCLQADETLTALKRKWASKGLDIQPDNLKLFKFETNSTASNISIYAKGFTIS